MNIVADTPARQQVERDGYVVFRGVLTAEEVAEIRTEMLKFFAADGRPYGFGKTQPAAFTYLPAIRWLTTHPRILASVRAAMGREDVQFTLHSDCHMNILSGWHTDTGAYFRPEEVAPEDFQVFKVGLYLQDHSANAQGLTVSEGSHRAPNVLLKDTVKPLATGVGDIIVFDVRIWHIGDRAKLWDKLIGRAVRSESTKHRIGARLRQLMGRPDKLSVFFTYGAPNEHTLEFARRNMVRQCKQTGAEFVAAPPELVAQLNQAGLAPVPLRGPLR